jgi:hypothetical protein
VRWSSDLGLHPFALGPFFVRGTASGLRTTVIFGVWRRRALNTPRSRNGPTRMPETLAASAVKNVRRGIEEFDLMRELLPVTGCTVVRSSGNAGDFGQNLRCIPVAMETRGHGELVHLPHDVHALDVSVTVGAKDSPVHVDAMIEIGEIRDLVDPLPGEGDPLLVVLGQLDDLRTVLLRDRVAVHADRNGGNVRMRRPPDRAVAILAVDLHGSSVKLMGEGNRLSGSIADTVSLGPGDIIGRNRRRQGHKENQRNPDLQKVVKLGSFHALGMWWAMVVFWRRSAGSARAV